MEAVGPQLFFHIPRGLRFLAAYLGMGMQMPPGLHHAVLVRINGPVELPTHGFRFAIDVVFIRKVVPVGTV